LSSFDIIALKEFLELERKLEGEIRGKNKNQNIEIPSSTSPIPTHSKILERPKEPEPYECCGNGCHNCVWIGYWEKLQEYENGVKKSKS